MLVQVVKNKFSFVLIKIMTGRKKDPIWVYFDNCAKESGKLCERVLCKKCKAPVQKLVARMKAHISVCRKDIVDDPDVEIIDELHQVPSTSSTVAISNANPCKTK